MPRSRPAPSPFGTTSSSAAQPLNRAGLHVSRMRAAQAMADLRRRRLAHLITPADVTAFQRDGFILKENFLAPQAFEALRREALDNRAPARDMIQGDAVTRRIALDRAALADLPALRSLLGDPRWLGPVRYVGSSALSPQTYIQTVFSQAGRGRPDPQTELHADTFHTSVKAWLFLTDVAEHDGPLVYVPGSHRLTKRRLAWERRASIVAHDHNIFEASRGSPRIKPEDLSRLGLPPPRIRRPRQYPRRGGYAWAHARGRSHRPTARVEIWASWSTQSLSSMDRTGSPWLSICRPSLNFHDLGRPRFRGAHGRQEEPVATGRHHRSSGATKPGQALAHDPLGFPPDAACPK